MLFRSIWLAQAGYAFVGKVPNSSMVIEPAVRYARIDLNSRDEYRADEFSNYPMSGDSHLALTPEVLGWRHAASVHAICAASPSG